MEKLSTAERLNEYMNMYNLKQTDLLMKCLPYCRKHGITIDKSVISRYVNGRRKPTAENIIMFAEVLGVSEAWLAGYDVPMERTAVSDAAEDLASIAKDSELLSYVHKVQILDAEERAKVYGYTDAVYDLYIKSRKIDDV